MVMLWVDDVLSWLMGIVSCDFVRRVGCCVCASVGFGFSVVYC